MHIVCAQKFETHGVVPAPAGGILARCHPPPGCSSPGRGSDPVPELGHLLASPIEFDLTTPGRQITSFLSFLNFSEHTNLSRGPNGSL